MDNLRTLTNLDINLANKRVLIREDFNLPIENGKITNDARLIAALPTIKNILEQKASVILLSHLGRPKPGLKIDSKFNQIKPEFSLSIIIERLAELLGQKVTFKQDWINGFDIKAGEIVLCENVRLLAGEEDNNLELAKKMANLCDVFVMDAFASAHRAHASTSGIAQLAKRSVAGPLLVRELEALSQVLQDPARPVVAIVGGAKVSSKLTVLKNLLNKVDTLIVGGGIANTFLAATDYPIGDSLYESNLVPVAKDLLGQAKLQNCRILIPEDVITADGAKILDIGIKTQKYYADILSTAKTILWNGPVGVFEMEAYAAGTKAVAEAIAKSNAYSVAGGGDTLAAIDKFKVRDGISYISTGGGAFLEYLEGRVLPGIVGLKV